MRLLPSGTCSLVFFVCPPVLCHCLTQLCLTVSALLVLTTGPRLAFFIKLSYKTLEGRCKRPSLVEQDDICCFADQASVAVASLMPLSRRKSMLEDLRKAFSSGKNPDVPPVPPLPSMPPLPALPPKDSVDVPVSALVLYKMCNSHSTEEQTKHSSLATSISTYLSVCKRQEQPT